MALYALPRTALAESDADGTNGSNIVANAVITVTDLDGGTVVMYDDADGTGGATSKLTNAKGQKDIYLPSGEYIVSINSLNPQRVTVGNPKEITTTGLINSSRKWQAGDTITTTGYLTPGDGGGAMWRKTGNTGSASQSPSQLGNALLNDANGDEWELVNSGFISIDSIGAKGDGSTDDTLVFSAASSWIESLASSTVDGYGITLRPGAVYMIDTWKLPKYGSGGKRTYIGCQNGFSTIRKLTTANTSYMVAPAKYVENLAFADPGFHFENIEFDGNESVDVVFICRNYTSFHINCRFMGANLNSFLLTRKSANGTDSSSTLSETRIEKCDFEAGSAQTGALFKSEGSGAASNPADIFLLSNTFQCNGVAPYCVDASKTNGWHLDGNHTYNATDYDLLIRDISRIASFSGNQLEEGAYITCRTPETINLGPGNTTWNNVYIGFDAAYPSAAIMLSNWWFRQNKAGTDTARLFNLGALNGHVVYSRDNVFEGARFDNHVSGSGGRIFSRGDLDADGEIPLSVIPSSLKSVGADIPTYTTTQIGDITDPINTDGKYQGKAVFANSTGSIYVSSGSSAGASWTAQRSSASDITPS